MRATELRKGLAEAPIVATSDPLPAAFSATLGRLVALGGAEGVALLLTIVVELISCFGLAGLSVLSGGREDRERVGGDIGEGGSLHPGNARLPRGSLPIPRRTTSRAFDNPP